MSNLKYTFTRGPLMDAVSEQNLDSIYLANYKAKIEKQLVSLLQQIVDDDAEIELTVAPNGKEILYWKVAKWNAAGYDKLITSNII
jgi:hypothetical protein